MFNEFVLIDIMACSFKYQAVHLNIWACFPHRPVLNASLAMASRFLWHDPDLHHTFYISDIPMVTWVLGILWLIPLVFINEGIKLHEIR